MYGLIVLVSGFIEKMKVQYNSGRGIEYHLPIGEKLIHMNPLIGKKLRLEHVGGIECLNCGRATKKSYSQGYCYVCMTTLARCDSCIMSPEKCHIDKGTCREPEWADKFCMTDHIVYLANSSGIKVGITRHNQIPNRWIDQGAIQALPIFRVANRKLSGLVEVAFKEFVADKTNWRKMLKNEVSPLDLYKEKARLIELTKTSLDNLIDRYGTDSIRLIHDAEVLEFDYPVTEYPSKISSYNLDKSPIVESTLVGIKGQYLIFEEGVINLRKYTSYNLCLTY
ncbi:DUF2797 domain-containing protein [Pseudoalteromonas nigrifaciens]|uniref:DUF2797 domain-containing protein n=1 Tax=Pseudoalteromonas nigrifaciens TaxID=28109 RepID=UPI003D0368DC